MITTTTTTIPTSTSVDSGIDSGSSPDWNRTMSNTEDTPMSRTHQYRKVMKPLLERKRRARINKCLDDLKDIMVSALETEGEAITKLEKADVLELTVRHLRRLKGQNALGLTPEATYAGRFKAGYTHCAREVSRFMSVQVGGEVDAHVSARLLSHLGSCIHALENLNPSSITSHHRPSAFSPVLRLEKPQDFSAKRSTTPPTPRLTGDPSSWRPW